jgi:hypothetical protein
VHYLREALLSAAPAGVAIDATGLTPVFKESEWWAANNSNQTVTDLYSAYSSASVYSNFGTGGIEIMDGIKVFKDSGDNKPMIAYNRPIKIAKIALGTGNQYGASYTFHVLGLKKESSGSISLEGSTIEIYGGVNGTWTYDNNSIDFTTYEAFLEEAGLYPSGTMLPDHSKITIESAGRRF